MDQVQNFIKEIVSGTHLAAATTVNVVNASLFPDPASGQYNLTWWDATNYPDPSGSMGDPKREIVRVTGRDTGANTLTVTRAQEGTLASDKNTAGATYLLALCPTKKTMDDIDSRVGLITPASASAPASLDLAEDTDNGTNKITITAPSAVASDKVITLPDVSGTIALIDMINPIGTIREFNVATNPATLLGFGTWAAFGTGRVTVAIDAGQTEFDTNGETGGEKTHLLTGAESGTSVHAHGQRILQTAGTGAYDQPDNAVQKASSPVDNLNFNTGNSSAANAASAHNNLQPYIVVYRWVRTA